MADHDVFFTLPERQLGRADIEFKIKRNGSAFGRLLVSEGSIEWLPAGKQSGIRVTWAELDRFAREKTTQNHTSKAIAKEVVQGTS